LNVTVLLPWLKPKFAPTITTGLPGAPEAGEMVVIVGEPDAVTSKFAPLLGDPDTVTTTFPVVAPEGTIAVSADPLQLVGIAGVPLNVTVLVLWLDPKFAPLIVTVVPTGPEGGDRVVMLAGDMTSPAM
jgi:hypothetical protein